jgi:DNA invertase Pin-like site-specific DNA recombinase
MSQTAAATRATGTIASHKIQPRHLERSAAVYVRQSTMQQIVHHQESTRMQYGLADLAERLGWMKEQVLVIDEDLGVSGASSEGRAGFQKLLADVALDRIGLILGVEMSRLARSCKDWYQLLELCAIYGTLIGDLDGLYDPAQYNDRLLLGLKGTMSEAELHVLRQRLQQGQLAKARRGELGRVVPIGYARRPSGEIVLDPDEEARATVKLVFEQFDRIGTVGGVLKYLVTQGIKLGVRVQSGPGKGELEWRRPNREALHNMIHNPAYAGVYAYGRRATDPRRRRPGHRGTGRIMVPREQWVACLRDRLPAYIPWDQYERNVARLAAHRSRAPVRGAVRKGAALLQGIVICGRCGARMSTHYSTKSAHVRYQCQKERTAYGGSLCQGLSARGLDAEVSRLALRALAPAALEVSLKVGEDVERTRAELEARWKRRLERAKYEADRASRQYHAVEPENRLVARTLEAAWEEKLREQRKLGEEHERSCRELPRVLTDEERQAIRALAADLPALWSARTTTVEDRKAILRQVVDRVVVNVEGDTEWVEATVHWAGGQQTYTRFRRPVAQTRQLSGYADIRTRLRELKDEGLSSPQIAKRLNAEGWRRPRRAARFTRRAAWRLLAVTGVTRVRRRGDRSELGADEWWIPDLAREVGCTVDAIHKRIRRGAISCRQLGGARGRWVVRATRDEIARLRADRADLGPGEWWVPDLARELGYTVYAIYKWIASGRVCARPLDGPLGRQVVCVTEDELARLRERSRRKHARRNELRKPRSAAGAEEAVHTVQRVQRGAL